MNFGSYPYYPYGSGNANINNCSAQILVDKQKQSLKYSYITLGNLLSAAENFAGFYGEKYGQITVTHTKSGDYNSLKSEFAWELECFSKAKEKYEKTYGPYQFPDDVPKEIILEDIQKYIHNIQNKKDIILYQIMADLIKGKKVSIDFQDLYKECDKNANSKFDPRKLNPIIGPLNQVLDQAEKEAEIGDMNFFNANKSSEKAKEQLRNLPYSHSKKVKVFLGEKGKLILSRNGLYFESDVNKTKQLIEGIEPSKIKTKTFYFANQKIIFVSQVYKTQANCVLFSENNKKNVSENSITKDGNLTLLNELYTYGTYSDSKGNKFDIIFKVEEENENDYK